LGVGVKGLSNCGFTSVSDERWPCQTAVTYRAAFSFGRIVDELWGVIAILWVVCFATLFQQMIESPWDSVVFLVGFPSLGLASYRFLPSIVRATMPRELRDAFPEDRFAGPSSPLAPRTYRELVRRWASPKRDSGGGVV